MWQGYKLISPASNYAGLFNARCSYLLVIAVESDIEHRFCILTPAFSSGLLLTFDLKKNSCVSLLALISLWLVY